MSAQEANDSLVQRQIEISEWTYNNKMETLFVFQLLFIALLIVLLVFVLKGAGYIGALFSWYVVLLVAVLMIMILVNRLTFTINKRDSRYWNRQRFAEDNKLKSPIGPNDESYQEYLAAVKGAAPTEPGCVCPSGR